MLKFTCALLGNKGTGKTSFVKRLKTGEFVEKHKATKKLKVYKLDFDTKIGVVHFFVWDTTNTDDLDYLNLNCAIIFVDRDTQQPHTDIFKFQNALLERQIFVPIVICRNKIDLKSSIRIIWDVLHINADNIRVYDISVKNTYNCELPFLWFSRILLSDPNIKFKTQIALDPPYAPVDPVEVALHIIQLGKVPLPTEDDW